MSAPKDGTDIAIVGAGIIGISVAYYLVKKQSIVLGDLYTMSPKGSLHFEGGWNPRALIALALSGALSIGLSLAGAFGLMFNVGDWGWLIGSTSGALLYVAISSRGSPALAIRAGATR